MVVCSVRYFASRNRTVSEIACVCSRSTAENLNARKNFSLPLSTRRRFLKKHNWPASAVRRMSGAASRLGQRGRELTRGWIGIHTIYRVIVVWEDAALATSITRSGWMMADGCCQKQYNKTEELLAALTHFYTQAVGSKSLGVFKLLYDIKRSRRHAALRKYSLRSPFGRKTS